MARPLSGDFHAAAANAQATVPPVGADAHIGPPARAVRAPTANAPCGAVNSE